MHPDQKTFSSSQRQFGLLNAGWVLGGVAFLTLPVALFASKGLAPLYIITAVLVLALSFTRRRLRHFLPLPLSGIIAAFVSFAAISALWSIEPGSSLRSALIVALTGFGGLVIVTAASRLCGPQRGFFDKALIAGGALGLFIVLFEQTTGWALTKIVIQYKGLPPQSEATMAAVFNPGMAICALYAWPWLLTIRKKFGSWPTLAALGLVLVVMILSSAETPLLALVLGIVVAAGSIVSRKLVFGLFTALIVLGTLGAPLLPGALPDPETETSRYPGLSHSALHRLSIWRTAGERISESPVLGFGMNATRHLYDKSDQTKRTYDTDNPNRKSWYNNFEPIPLHAHNGILQVWLERGGVGALLFLGVLLAIMRAVYARMENSVHSAFGLGMMTSGIFIYSPSFGP